MEIPDGVCFICCQRIYGDCGHENLQKNSCVCSTEPGEGYPSLCSNGQLASSFARMDQHGSSLSVGRYKYLLKACTKSKDLLKAKQIRAHIDQHGLKSSSPLGEYIVDTFVKCGGLQDAIELFNDLPVKSALSWTAVISGYANCGQGQEALRMYAFMQEEGVQPNTYTFVSLLKACGNIARLDAGKRIHEEAHKCGCVSDLFVGNSLVNMYGKCGSILDAQIVFDGMCRRDVVSWNAMVAALIDHGLAEKAMSLYQQMREVGISPNSRTFVSVFQACGMLADVEDGFMVNGQGIKVKSWVCVQAVSADAHRHGYYADVFVASILVTVYRRCGSIGNSQNVFDSLAQYDVVTWNAIIAAYVDEGQGEKGLQLYEQMIEEGLTPNHRTLVNAIQICSLLASKEDAILVDEQPTKVKGLELGKAIHAYAVRKGYDADVFLGNTLVGMYGKCGSIVDAKDVFGKLLLRDVVSWNAMLTAYTQQGKFDCALQLYKDMQEEGVSPDDWTFNTIVTVHGRCGNLVDAQNVFDALARPDVVTWNALLAAYGDQGQREKALELYTQMHEEGFSPTVRSFVTVVQACGMWAESKADVFVAGQFIKARSLGLTKVIHAEVSRKGYQTDIFIGCTMVSTYGKCGSTVDARNWFDSMLSRNVVLWNAMMTVYLDEDKGEEVIWLYEQMLIESVSPSDGTFIAVMQACGMLADKERADRDGLLSKTESLSRGKIIHSRAWGKGYDSDVYVGNTLVRMYGKCGGFLDAQIVFDRLSHRDLVAWTGMLVVYVEQRQGEQALQLYEQIREEGLSPDAWTFVIALQACGLLALNEEGVVVDTVSMKAESLQKVKGLHAEFWMRNDSSDLCVGSTLIHVYGSCGSLADAQDVFDITPRNVVSWNALLEAYVGQGRAEPTLQLFDQMQLEHFSPDNRTFISALHACSIGAENEDATHVLDGESTKADSLKQARAIRTQISSKGYEADAFVGSRLISTFGKCGSILDARDVFDKLPHRDVVTWTAMLTVYVEQDQGEMALQLYREMRQENVNPDEIALVRLLQACGNTGSLDVLQQAHQTINVDGRKVTPLLGNTLITAYGGCASMVDAQAVFDALPGVDVISWNALIGSYAKQGNSASTLHCYRKMLSAGVSPDAVTFCSLLYACSHAGLVVEGVEYFESMIRDHGLTPDMEHYVSMVDLLGRAGYFTEIEALLSKMPMQPDLKIWVCMLGACRTHGKVELAEQVFNCAMLLDPKDIAIHVLMSHIYADAGLVHLAKAVRETVPT